MRKERVSRMFREAGGCKDEDSDKRHHPRLLDELSPKKPQSKNAEQEQTIKYWRDQAKATVEQLVKKKENTNRAKNVIMFLGDGMSIATVAMARVYAGGEEKPLFFEEFPYIGMAKTYCVDYQVADSACTATAYLTGVKANYETIGVNAHVQVQDCHAARNRSTHTTSIAQWAMDAGKDAGIVTTTRVTHASPAGVYAHTSYRDWENDFYVKEDGCTSEQVDDIAHQLVYGETAPKLRVILGGGRREFLDRQTGVDPETGNGGYRSDGRNLIDEWLKNGPVGENRTFVWKRSELMAVDPLRTDRLLGMFEPSHCAYNLDRVNKGLDEEPTLSEMVDKATDMLSLNPNGFFLFVEGGRIDHAHHDNRAKLALDETVEFDKAIEFARKKFSEEDTLIVVTSDHSHSVSYAGYPRRGNDIFGTAGTGRDGLPYMTISYANGPGHKKHVDKNTGTRMDVREMDRSKDNFDFPAMVPKDSETHGGEDVAVYASGPWSHLFAGSFEQNVIPHMMGYAACIGAGMHAYYDSDKRHHPRLRDELSPKSQPKNAEQEQTIKYWRDQAKATVERLVKKKENTNTAKNVIMFLGDGMSIATEAKRNHCSSRNSRTSECRRRTA
ncbi:alkaline phosphatase [Anopheles darlingi]|uniref:Alkaline phosphatase n=1 Tax=Anopheles darlingi TaxID=43151 RepID=W5JCJ1_ANODA|nr:alkaline phosphatase [Anopheles darlingi]